MPGFPFPTTTASNSFHLPGFLRVSELFSKIHHHPAFLHDISSRIRFGSPVHFLFRNWILQIELCEVEYDKWISWNYFKGKSKILPTGLPVTLLKFFKDAKHFIIFPKACLYSSTLRQCRNSHMFVHGLLHHCHFVYLIKGQIFGPLSRDNQNGEIY